jgi:hypothetical protein
MRKRNFLSEIRKKKLKTKKRLRERNKKGVREKDLSPFVQAVRKGPIRSLNEVDLIVFGSAWLFMVTRLCAWRGVRADASHFGVLRSRRSLQLEAASFCLWDGRDRGVSFVIFINTSVVKVQT